MQVFSFMHYEENHISFTFDILNISRHLLIDIIYLFLFIMLCMCIMLVKIYKKSTYECYDFNEFQNKSV